MSVAVAPDLALVATGRLSFQGVGLATAPLWNAIWISPTGYSTRGIRLFELR